MSASAWLDYRDRKKIAAFAVLCATAFIFSAMLPSGAWSNYGAALPASFRGRPPLPADMLIAWMLGWFIILFIRVEDLNVLAPVNYQAGCRFVGILLVCVACVIAVVLGVRFF